MNELGLAITKVLPGSFDDRDVARLLAWIDRDGSGEVSCAEFTAFCTSVPEALGASDADAAEERARMRRRAAPTQQVATGGAGRRERQTARREAHPLHKLLGAGVDPAALSQTAQHAGGIGAGALKQGEAAARNADLSAAAGAAQLLSPALRAALEKLEVPAERFELGSDGTIRAVFSGGDMDHTQFKQQLVQHLGVRLTPEELGALCVYFCVKSDAGSGFYTEPPFSDAPRVDCAAFLLYFQRMAVAIKARQQARWRRVKEKRTAENERAAQLNVERRLARRRAKLAPPSEPDFISAMAKLERAAAFVDSRTCPLRNHNMLAFVERAHMDPTEFREQLKNNLQLVLSAGELGTLVAHYDIGALHGEHPRGLVGCNSFLTEFMAIGRSSRRRRVQAAEAATTARHQQASQRVQAQCNMRRAKAAAKVVWPAS